MTSTSSISVKNGKSWTYSFFAERRKAIAIVIRSLVDNASKGKFSIILPPFFLVTEILKSGLISMLSKSLNPNLLYSPKSCFSSFNSRCSVYRSAISRLSSVSIEFKSEISRLVLLIHERSSTLVILLPQA